MKPTANTCASIQAHLPLFAGGDLEPDLAIAAREHTTQCAVCAGELRRIEDALGAIATLKTEPALEIDVWPAVRGELIEAGVVRDGSLIAPIAMQPALGQSSASDAALFGSTRSRAWWLDASRVRRVAAAAALVLGFGVAAFYVAEGTSPSFTPGDASEHGVDAASQLDGASGEVADLASTPAPAARPLVAKPGALRRATPDEEKVWFPPQRFNSDALESVGPGSSVQAAGDHRLR